MGRTVCPVCVASLRMNCLTASLTRSDALTVPKQRGARRVVSVTRCAGVDSPLDGKGSCDRGTYVTWSILTYAGGPATRACESVPEAWDGATWSEILPAAVLSTKSIALVWTAAANGILPAVFFNQDIQSFRCVHSAVCFNMLQVW